MAKLGVLFDNAFESTSYDLDNDVTILAAGWVYRDFTDNKTGDVTKNVALKIKLQLEDGSEIEPFPYNLGNSAQWIPSADGKMVEPTEQNTKGMSVKCGAYHFLAELLKAGYPKPKLDELDIDAALVNLKGHILSVPTLDAEGKQVKNAQGFPKSTPYFTKVLQLPWEKAPSAKGKAAPKAAPASAATNGEAPADLTEFVAKTLLAADGHTLKKVQINTKVLGPNSPFTDKEQRKALVQALNKPDFFKNLEPYVDLETGTIYNIGFDGTNATITEAA